MPKPSPRFRVSIQGRVFIGTALMCFLLLAMGCISLWGLMRFNRHFEDYLLFARESRTLTDVDNSTKEIQRRVVRFMFLGNSAAGSAALEDMAALEERITLAIEESGASTERHRILQDIQSRLQRYRKTFETAILERNIHARLVEEELPMILEDLEERLIRFHELPEVDHPADHVLLHLRTFSQKMGIYFTRYDQRYVEEAFIEIANLRQKAGDYSRNAGFAHAGFIGELDEGLTELERTTQRAVQATRSYLFLINVVMSGEAVEVLYLTEMLGNFARVGEENKRRELYELTGSTSLTVIFLLLAAVFIGLVYSFLMTRSINQPLAAITRTFRELSLGQRVEHIPEMGRRDEIGELAGSAEVFRQRNAETERLLRQSESLTADLKEKTRELEESNLQMEQFVYTVSHDLKSPIVTSMGFIGMMRDLAAAGNLEAALGKLDRVESANQRMGMLINDLLELSRVGRTDDPTEEVDMNHLFRDLKTSMSPVIAKSGFTIQLGGPFPPVLANESRILQIFENLLTNALKYGKAVGEETGRLEIWCEPEAERNVFKVRDFGQGVDDAYKEKIFNLFSHLHTGEGTGIGLCIVRKLARLYGGEAWVIDPKEGPGAEFCVAFPACNVKI